MTQARAPGLPAMKEPLGPRKQSEPLGFRIGVWLGVPLALGFALASWLRRSRAIHPRGLTYVARVEPIEAHGEAGQREHQVRSAVGPESRGREGPDASSIVGSDECFETPHDVRLVGTALVRFSGVIWKRERRRFDILGIALRFGWREGDPVKPRPSDQDLLVATVKHAWMLPLAPLLTNASSFFANTYFAIAPFRVRERGQVKFRLVPERSAWEQSPSHAAVSAMYAKGDANRRLAQSSVSSTGREAELSQRAATNQARFTLEMRDVGSGVGSGVWHPLVHLVVERRVMVDEDTLLFSPDNAGAGIEPIGVLNGLRRYTYLASQAARTWARRLSGESSRHPSSLAGEFHRASVGGRDSLLS